MLAIGRGGHQKAQTYLDVLLHTLEVETNSPLVEVSVPDNLHARLLHYGQMVPPRWVREVHLLWPLVVLRQECRCYSQSSSARNGLSDGDL
jgi:hypothetical protein